MKKYNIALSIILLLSVLGIILYAMSQGIAVLDPAGLISEHQRNMFWLSVSLGLLALIPVFIMTTIIVYRYRSHDDNSTDSQGSKWQVKPLASWMWTSFVVLIIATLAVFMYKSTFAIDPYKPIAVAEDSLAVRVVALPWKWLFIYPEENIATINELVIPVDTEIAFELTADAPMSSFWIPKLGGMIYAMEGMVTKLHLQATSTGEFEGMNTEINGKGYSGMRFKTMVVTSQDYKQWVADVRVSANTLDSTAYQKLAQPSTDNTVQHYAAADPSLFGQILSKFMSSSHHSENNNSTNSHE